MGKSVKEPVVAAEPVVEMVEKKKKKKKTAVAEEEPVVAVKVEKRPAEEEPAAEEGEKKKKKKKSKKTGEEAAAEEPAAPAEEPAAAEEAAAEEPAKKKKKKSKKTEEAPAEEPVEEKKDVEMKDSSDDEEVTVSKPAEAKTEESTEDKIFKVIVTGLPWGATEEQVQKDFGECGEITDFGLPMDRESGQAKLRQLCTSSTKGIAFITYTTKEAMDKAIEFNETDYQGRTIRVKVCEEKGGKGKDGKGKGKGKDGKGKKGGKGKGSWGPSEKPDGCMSVVVKRLNNDTTEDALWTFFEKCGTIEKVKLLTDRDTGASKGMAFVDFAATEGTDEAVKLNGSELDNWNIVVDFNVPREKGEGKDGKGKGKGKGKDGKGKGKKGGKKGKGSSDAAKKATGGLVESTGAKKTFDSDSD